MRIEIKIDRKDEMFTHHNKDTGEVLHFAITAMNTFVERYGLVNGMRATNINNEPSLIERLRKDFGIEQPRLDSLTPELIERPVLIVEWGDGTSTIVDGNHRVVRRFELGMEKTKAIIFPPNFYKEFTFDAGYDKEKIIEHMDSGGHSGITPDKRPNMVSADIRAMPDEAESVCYANGCSAVTPPTHAFCKHHNAMLPYRVREDLKRLAKLGRDKRFIDACVGAMMLIHRQENRDKDPTAKVVRDEWGNTTSVPEIDLIIRNLKR